MLPLSRRKNKWRSCCNSDFQCPFCQQVAQPFRELQTKGIDGVKTTVQFKNFPLSIHPNAQMAHRAAMAAKHQGKFWEMHDLLFANPQRVQRDGVVGYAKALGLDLPAFKRTWTASRFRRRSRPTSPQALRSASPGRR